MNAREWIGRIFFRKKFWLVLIVWSHKKKQELPQFIYIYCSFQYSCYSFHLWYGGFYSDVKSSCPSHYAFHYVYLLTYLTTIFIEHLLRYNRSYFWLFFVFFVFFVPSVFSFLPDCQWPHLNRKFRTLSFTTNQIRNNYVLFKEEDKS